MRKCGQHRGTKPGGTKPGEPAPSPAAGGGAAKRARGSGAPEFGEGGDGSKPNGDWTCFHCGNSNYSSRSRCNMRKCNMPRGECFLCVY
jgi:hypothetical protein